MKVSIMQSDLLESLKIVARAVSGNNTLPVLGNILLKAEGRKLHLSATNLEISISTSVAADVKNEGSLTVPAKILTSYTSLLDKADDVELKVADGLALELVSATSKTRIKGIDASEFPEIKTVDHGQQLAMSAEDFRATVGQVAFAAQENAARPILAGVFVQAQKDKVKFAATDSYRLSEKELQVKGSSAEVACVIPVRALHEADRLVGGEEDINLTISENEVMFSIGATQLVSRLIEGQFPPYQEIIPSQHETKVEIPRETLALAVRRVSIFAKENNQHMKLEFLSDGRMQVSTDATQIGEEQTNIPVKIEGSTTVMALNTDYVLDMLAAINDEKVVLEMSGKMSPAVFKRPGKTDFIHLIMPLKA